MLKKFLFLLASSGLFIQAAAAAPIGWYDLNLAWRDGTFNGRVLYDASSPYQSLQVVGALTDLAQTTAINDVWNVSNTVTVGPGTPLTFTNWADPGDPLNYNAAFSLVLVDLGNVLAVENPGQSWGLYDWSNPDFFNMDQLSDSPLLSWNIAPVAANAVPEPGALPLLGLGVFGLALARRRNQSRRAA